MSYLNSILSSIGGSEQAPKAPAAKPPSRTASPLNRPNVPPSNIAASPAGTSSKRKADEDGQAGIVANKAPRRDAQPVGPRPVAAAPPNTVARPVANGSLPAAHPRPNGTATASGRPTVKTSTSTAAGKTPATPVPASAAPKKGSFADIMARAAAAQKASTAKPSLGTIQHKPTEKISVQEKKARLEQLKTHKSVGRGGRSASRPLSRSQSPDKGKHHQSVSAHTPKRTPGDSGYKGTMRATAATAPSYRGTMRGGTAPSREKATAKSRYAGYTSHSEEDDFDEEEDASDDLSDMEAGLDEMDEEEAASLALAKREDLEAKREEERLKREKEQRKRLLQRR